MSGPQTACFPICVRVLMSRAVAFRRPWVSQQARNLSWTLEDEGVKLSVLIVGCT
jgi:hypothetical protein